MTCRCAEGVSEPCYQAALADAQGDPKKIQVVELLNRSRLAQGLPFHLVDPVIIRQVATLLKSAQQENKRT